MLNKPRLVDRLQGKYVPAPYEGKNTSGVSPLGKKVLVRMDRFEPVLFKGHGGIDVVQTDTRIDAMNAAAESGVIIECGPEAFSYHQDGFAWKSRKPQPGEHVYCDKFPGILVMGNDANIYRLMDDYCIGAIYTVYPKEDGEAPNGDAA